MCRPDEDEGALRRSALRRSLGPCNGRGEVRATRGIAVDRGSGCEAGAGRAALVVPERTSLP